MMDRIERDRVALQVNLDAQKTQAERNRLGQFSTPQPLAADILAYAKTMLPREGPVRFLDPAIGTGSFYSALRTVFPLHRIEKATGFEVDDHYYKPAADLWAGHGLELACADFTEQTPRSQYNLIICNPPYVRHHHLTNEQKSRLLNRTVHASGIKLSGLAGLYCHFLGLCHSWLADDGIAGWLIPSEFMDVNYGRAVKQYLLQKVTLLHIHRFDPADLQFADALVSSAVVWFKKSLPKTDHDVTFTMGGSLMAPNVTRTVRASDLAQEAKWTRFPCATTRAKHAVPTIGDFFRIKRGIATGDNSFFVLPAEEIRARNLPMEVFRPILPSPRYLTTDRIGSGRDGVPEMPRKLFLLDTRLPELEIERRFPSLAAYLKEGKSRGLQERYLCRHRNPWYAQENRPPAPIVCTYIGRCDTKSGRPFRFILNESTATVANVYLAMYPTARLSRAMLLDPLLIERIWRVLNSLTPEQLLSEGRVYGGGLHKLEPKELANVPVAEIAAMLPEDSRAVQQGDLLAPLAINAA